MVDRPTLQPPDTRHRRGYLARNALGVLALVSGIAGLASRVLPPALIDPPARRLRDELKSLVLDVATGHGAAQDSYQAALRNWERAAIVLGFVAIVLAVIARIRAEHRVVIALAVGLGAVALLWEYIAAALFVGIVLAVIAAVVS